MKKFISTLLVAASLVGLAPYARAMDVSQIGTAPVVDINQFAQALVGKVTTYHMELMFPGKYFQKGFVPGMNVSGRFIPGVVINGEFQPGIVTSDNRFIHGIVYRRSFIPGMLLAAPDGVRSMFVLGIYVRGEFKPGTLNGGTFERGTVSTDLRTGTGLLERLRRAGRVVTNPEETGGLGGLPLAGVGTAYLEDSTGSLRVFAEGGTVVGGKLVAGGFSVDGDKIRSGALDYLVAHDPVRDQMFGELGAVASDAVSFGNAHVSADVNAGGYSSQASAEEYAYSVQNESVVVYSDGSYQTRDEGTLIETGYSGYSSDEGTDTGTEGDTVITQDSDGNYTETDVDEAPPSDDPSGDDDSGRPGDDGGCSGPACSGNELPNPEGDGSCGAECGGMLLGKLAQHVFTERQADMFMVVGNACAVAIDRTTNDFLSGGLQSRMYCDPQNGWTHGTLVAQLQGALVNPSYTSMSNVTAVGVTPFVHQQLNVR